MGLPRFLPFLLSLILVAACQDDSPDRPSTDVTEPVAESPVSEGAQTILDLIEANASLSTLEELIQRAELDSTLAAEGPVTLFAPTNAAFSDVDTSTDALTNDELKSLLAYHVIQTRMQTLDIPGDMTIGALNSEELSLHPEGNGFAISDANGNRARVVTPDLSASNGVVHMIDRVLVPGR